MHSRPHTLVPLCFGNTNYEELCNILSLERYFLPP